MNKIKFVIGTINRFNPFLTEQEQERIYQESYKPFANLLFHLSDVKVACYYSGMLLKWFEEKHPEYILLLKDLCQSGKMEILSSGFYEPVFNLINVKCRGKQLDLMSTYIRKVFNQKATGICIPNDVWEPSLPSNLANNGINYLFLPTSLFVHSGLDEEKLFQPFISEDQGKTVTVFPIHEFLVDIFYQIPASEWAKRFSNFYLESNEILYINLLIDGNLLGKEKSPLFDFFTENRLEKFLDFCKEQKDFVEIDFPRNYLKTMGKRKKIYLQCDQDLRLSGKMLSPDKRIITDMLKNHLSQNELVNFVNLGFFRQFLMKYREADAIYQKQQWVESLIGYVKDKEQKKAALELLYKAQRGDLYSYNEQTPGIYDNLSRKAVYRDLIEAEKRSREKGVFKPNIILTDYNMNGIDEILFNGQYYNLYLTKEGGEVFEFDYFPANWNFCDTMSRYKESYNVENADSFFDDKSPHFFTDCFLEKDFSLQNADLTHLPSTIRFSSNLYETDLIDKEKKLIRFSASGTVQNKGGFSEVEFIKEFNFKKDIELSIEIVNKEEELLNIQYLLLMNIAAFPHNEKITFLKNKNGVSTELPKDFTDAKSIEGFIMEDGMLASKMEFTASKNFTLYKQPVATEVKIENRIVSLFQYYAFGLLWNISIRPKSSWKLKLTLKLTKK